ncbi:MAG: NAD(P)-binding domain-containing protein [Polyangiaceae bacterium]
MSGGSSEGIDIARGKSAGRSRVARKAERTSDVLRFRGVLAGALVCAVVALGAYFVGGGGVISAPGPLSDSHVKAGVACETCHTGEDGKAAVSACVGCHGPHPSTRPGHLRLSQAGRMSCSTCHRAHGGGEVVELAPDGVAWVRRAGAEAVKLQVAPIGGSKRLKVPTPPLARCAGCHRTEAKDDPIARCKAWAGGKGGELVNVCFDEHRVAAAAGQSGGAERDAAYEQARVAVASVAPGSRRSLDLTWLGVSLAVALGLITSAAWRRRARGGKAAPQAATGPALAPAMVRRLPTIDESTCICCNACVDACPYDVLQLERYVAKVVRPDDCCGLTLCEQRCPNGSLVVREGEPIFDHPLVSENLEAAESAGVFLAGDVTGLPLIRNAINQGAQAMDSIAQSLQAAQGLQGPALEAHGVAARDVLDVLIVGAGPAGLSAGLAADEQRLDYLVVDQGSVAESIRSFPRGKLVFDQPLGVPKVGDLWLEESTKEELLAKWRRIVREQRLRIDEGWRVVRCERIAGGPPLGLLKVTLQNQDQEQRALFARRVLLAVGRRGTPRKLALDLPDATLDAVFYHLADARTFANKRVVLVGLGDVAMETAIAIGRQPGTQVTVVYRGETFKRGKRRNIQELERLVRGGRVELLWNSDVSSVASSGSRGEFGEGLKVWLTSGGVERAVDADALFVMIGSVAPWQLLESFGVRHGAPLPPEEAGKSAGGESPVSTERST